MTLNVERRSDFFSLLAASARAPEIPESADVYGGCAEAGIWTSCATAA
jgi:hypothetical protein